MGNLGWTELHGQESCLRAYDERGVPVRADGSQQLAGLCGGYGGTML